MIKIRCFILLFILPFCASSQNIDTVKKQQSNNIRPFIIPAVFIGYGIIAKSDNVLNRLDKNIQREIHTTNPNPNELPEDILRYVPALAVYGLNLSGLKGKNNLVDASGIYLISNVIMGVSVKLTKNLTSHERPDLSDTHSFPSGHSSSAFASAEFLRQEYRDVSAWYGYAGYTVATVTGVMRLRNNKHWFGDVVAGAGFGIASTKIAYLVYPEVKKLFSGKHHSNYTLMPSYQPQFYGINFNARF